MTHDPTGDVVRTPAGLDLVLTRRFAAPAEDVWASVVEPDRTARWLGPWRGEGAPGKTVQLRLSFEEGAPWTDVAIEACEPPRRLAVATLDEAGAWRMELTLAEAGGVTELRFVQHRDDAAGIGEIGPGWEWYLDRLVAARDGVDALAFDAYYPAMKARYEALARRAR
jgi:uncharacterized protein YndB with AHSA1/START domain